MPNLVGIWDPKSSEEQIVQILSKQLHRVRTPGVAAKEYVSVHPGFGAALSDPGILDNGVQPARTPDGRISLLFDGELYNAGELRRRFRKLLPKEAVSTPELCLLLILAEGEDVIRLFNGLFSLTIYDRAERRLKLMSDRYGFRPLFYTQKDGALYFGSELKALCVADKSARQFDEIGTLELFCYGAQFQERTWLRGYMRLEPATILTVEQSGSRKRRYWSYKYQENAPYLDQPTYFTLFGTLLDRAVERCMEGSHRIGILLSGGYDSRSVAAAIRKHHLPIPAFTFGHAGSRDVRFAARLSERLGLDHAALTDRGPYLYSYCSSIVWRTEGMLPFANTTSIRFHTLMKEKMDIFLTGVLAEFGGSHTWPQLLVARSRRSAIRAIFDHILGRRLAEVRRIFDPIFFERTFEGLRARFEESFSNVENDHPLNVADCWNVIHLQPRSTYQAPSIDRPLFEARAPHMDTELVDFLLTIPPYARLEQRVYKKMIAYRFPEIREIPCTNSGRPIDPNFASEYTKMLVSYAGAQALGPLRKLFRRPIPLGREFRDLNDDFREEPELVDKILGPLLDSGVYPSSIFNRRAIEEVVDEHYHKNGRHDNILALMISLGLAAKFFLHEDLSGLPGSTFQP
jgi:asparagine synthase (glutamine-hydrolysing)